jgi:hypothetical protein
MNLFLKRAFRLLVLASFLLTAAYVPAQENKRLLDWAMPDPKQNTRLVFEGVGKSGVHTDIRALELVEVNVAGKLISIGQDFFADEDWIGSLTFRLKNTSQKPILLIKILLVLPETHDGERSLGFSLAHGKESSTDRSPEVIPPVLPGQEIELKFTEERYKSQLEFNVKRSSMTSFKKALIGHVMVRFDEGTIWLGSRLPLRFQW